MINNHATFPTITSAYKLYGIVENTPADAWKAYGVAGANAVTQGSVWTDQAALTSGITGILKEEDYESVGAAIGVL